MALTKGGRLVLVSIATVVGVAVTASLGTWQMRRAAQKTALQRAIDSNAQQPTLYASQTAHDAMQAQRQYYRPVHLRGRWVMGRNVFLENRQMAGRVGFYLLTPFLPEGRADAVLVQRGWVPRDLRDRTLLPDIATPEGPIDVEGHIVPPPARLFEFAGAAPGPIRQNLDVDGFARETGLKLAPFSVQQADTASTASDGLSRRWPQPAVDVQKHYGYAFQWFALSALMTGLYVWFQLVRPNRRSDAAQ